MTAKQIRIILLIFALAATLTLFTACSREDPLPEENSVTFTDALGRTVTVRKEPNRVAAMIGSFADVWLLSGGSLCAAAEDAWDDFGLELPDAVTIGGAHSPNPELLLAADPDFVIASASTAAHVKLRDLLERAGITVAYFDVDNFRDYLQMLDICTDITGRKELYEQNGLAIQAQIDAVKAEFDARDLCEEERTVLLLRTYSGSVKAKGSEGTILGEMLADLGCINIADSDTSLLENLSIESIIRQNPHRIFVVTMGDDTQLAVENLNRMMAQNPAWGTLDAVTGDRLHLMDRKLFNMKPNARWAESYETLSSILLGEQ